MKKSDQIDKLAAALAKAQSEIESAIKNAENPTFRSKYADLAAIWLVARGPLFRNELSVVQTNSHTEKEICLDTTLLHVSGQWISGSLPLILEHNDMHGLGSAITYARRYGLAEMLGIVQEDDDGNSAVRQTRRDQEPQKHRQEEPKRGLDSISGGQRKFVCENCSAQLVLSKTGTTLYCPNFKNKARGDHSRVPAPRSA